MSLYKRLIKKTLRENVTPFTGERSNSYWRRQLGLCEDWFPIGGSGPTNSVSQTFAFGDPASGIEVTLSGLGGVEAHPSTVTIDGETYDAPTYNQLTMQGYAKPLGFNVNRRTDFQDVNPYLDASQEFAQKVGADYMMNARVQQTIRQEVETDLTKIAAKFDSSLIENMGQNIKLAVESIMNGQQPSLVAPPDPPFTGMSHEQMVDETNKVNDKYNKLLEPLQKELDSYAGQLAPAGLVAKINALVEKQSQETNALYEKYSKYNQEYGDLLAKRADEWGKFVNAIEDYRKGFSFNPPSQEVAQVANNTSMLPTFSGVPRYNPRFSAQLHGGFLFSDAIGSTLRYAFGLYDPKVPFKNSQSRELERSMLNTMSNAINSGTLSRDPGRPGFFKVGVSYDKRGTEEARDDWEGDGSLSNNRLTNMSAQGLLQIYSFKPTKKGIIVKDRFNLTGARTIGAAAGLSNTLNYYFGTKFSFEQDLANKLIDMGNAQIRKRGGDPNNDATAGFDLEFIIPWERVPNNHPLRGNIKKSTTWDRIQKHR